MRVLDSDAASLARFGPWPWPHATLAKLARELKAQGAALVVFAFPLDMPDPLSPQEPARAGSAGSRLRFRRATRSSAMPSPDDALSRSHVPARDGRRGFTLGADQRGARPSPQGAGDLCRRRRIRLAACRIRNRRRRRSPPIERTSLGTGALNLHVRRGRQAAPHAVGLSPERHRPCPRSTAEMLRADRRHSQRFVVRSDEGESGLLGSQPGIASFEALNRRSADRAGRIDVDRLFRPTARRATLAPPRSTRTGSRPARLANAIVILGPPGETHRHAGRHAQRRRRLCRGAGEHADRHAAPPPCLGDRGRTDLPRDLRHRLHHPVRALRRDVVGHCSPRSALPAPAAISWHLYSADHVLFDALGPGLALALVLRRRRARARTRSPPDARARVRIAFADSLPPHVIEQIARKPELLLKLDGESRTVTYLSCGVRGFGGARGIRSRTIPPPSRG